MALCRQIREVSKFIIHGFIYNGMTGHLEVGQSHGFFVQYGVIVGII